MPPTIPNNLNRTFVLIVDGDQSTMGDVHAKFDSGKSHIGFSLGATITSVLGKSLAQSPQWFTSYAGIFFRDSTQTPSVSTVITSTDAADFSSKMQAGRQQLPTCQDAVAGNQYTSASKKGQVFNAIATVLSDSSIQPRSHAFVLTMSAVEDIEDQDLTLVAIANTHTSVCSDYA